MRVLSDGRVRRTRSEWQTIMQAFAKSGLTVVEFCEREKISASVFAAWKRRLSESEAAPAGFVELKANASTSPSPPRPAPPTNAEFELTLPGGAVLRWKA
jgi:hypothetical protein